MRRQINAALGMQALCLLVSAGAAGAAPTLTLTETEPQNYLLKRAQPGYRNYAFDAYENYPNHTHPYEDAP